MATPSKNLISDAPMWLPELPDVEDQLRMGDIVSDVPFPDAKTGPDDDGVIRWPTKTKPGVVVEHCCNIAQKNVVRLARVSQQRVKKPDMLRAVLIEDPAREEPTADGSGVLRFSSSLMLLPDPPGLPSLVAPKVYLAALTTTVEFAGDLSWLRERRLGRMTPELRRTLRTKLAAAVSRTEEEDQAYFDSIGQTGAVMPA